ncbi:MAG TPA: YbaY family lipoprotein [Candidatus Polarisedimenticolaceae bacterium]|nr:YbaY family lipoprotein [Candidatus Polarisedimenticolaceae bacterium]
MLTSVALGILVSLLPAAADNRVKPKWAELKGEAVLAENAPVPAGALLKLTLQDLTPGVPKDSSITTQSDSVGTALPLPIALKYNENLIDPTRSYGLSAALVDAYGRATWETPIPVRVLTRGFEGKAKLTLRRVTATQPPSVISMTVDCGELRFDARVSDDEATLQLPDGPLVLKRADSKTVRSYSDGPTTFNVMGQTAYFRRGGKYYRDCTLFTTGNKP